MTSGDAILHLPPGYALPDADTLVQDARATLLQNLALHGEAKRSGVLLSLSWENHEGQATLRAAAVAPEVAAGYFEGRGLASLARIRNILDTMLLRHAHASQGEQEHSQTPGNRYRDLHLCLIRNVPADTLPDRLLLFCLNPVPSRTA